MFALLINIAGFLVLQYNSTGCQPVVKQLPWPPDHQITSMCFDPTISWLLVQTDNGNIFIIPALSMLVSCRFVLYFGLESTL